MAGLSDQYERVVLDGILGSGHLSGVPNTVYIALFTAAPTDSASGTEVTGGSYARVSVANTTTEWPAASTSLGTTSKANANAITFPAPTAGWGAVTHFAVMDASSAGNVIMYAALTTSRTINSGDAAPSFAAGQLALTLD